VKVIDTELETNKFWQKFIRISSMMNRQEKNTMRKLLTSAKYRKMPMQSVVKELFDLKTKNNIICKKNYVSKITFVEMENGVIDMTTSDDCLSDLQANLVPIIDHKSGSVETEKEIILKNIFEDAVRKESQHKTKDEIASCVLDIKNAVQCIEDDDSDYLYKIRAFEENAKIHVMKMMIAEEIVVEQNNHMSCPIAYCIMRDPVTTSNGHIYDRNR
jgi:hypothetical protein